MDYLNIALIVLVVAGVWAVVELALTLRSARKNVEEVASSANEVIAQAQPIVAKLDGMVDDLEPAVKQVTPIVEKANVAMDGANASLTNVNAILADVSTVSGTASAVTETVNGAVAGAASSVARAVKKVTGGRVDAAPALTGADEAAQASVELEPAAAPEPKAERRAVSYIDYGNAAGADDAAADAE